MNNHLKWAKYCLLGLVLTVSARADHKPGHPADAGMKGLVISGGFEGGFTYDFNPAIKETQWLVDNLHIKLQADVSDRVKVVFSNGVAIGKGSSTLGAPINTAAYYSTALLSNAGSNMVFANNAAYVDVAWMDGVNMAAGHFTTPFGMESMWSRYDMHTYYYSRTFSKALQTYGWLYDLGLKFTISKMIPGSLEVAVIDDRKAEGITPGLVARYAGDVKMGDIGITPAVSARAGRWHGGPKDLGFSAGVAVKTGAMFANLEWLMAMQKTPVSNTENNTDMSVYLEPGMDLGLATVSLKGEFTSNKPAAAGASSTSDFNVGAAVSHTYADKYRIRLTYQHQNISGKLGAHVNDLRVLFGTKF